MHDTQNPGPELHILVFGFVAYLLKAINQSPNIGTEEMRLSNQA
jgi:hypothetical protein